jgi:hypothetical protein
VGFVVDATSAGTLHCQCLCLPTHLIAWLVHCVRLLSLYALTMNALHAYITHVISMRRRACKAAGLGSAAADGGQGC